MSRTHPYGCDDYHDHGHDDDNDDDNNDDDGYSAAAQIVIKIIVFGLRRDEMR